MKGRKPTPTALRQLAGNPGKRAINEREPKTDGQPEAPDWFDAEQLSAWRWLRDVLVGMGVVGRGDTLVVAALARRVVDLRRADAALREAGYFQTDPETGVVRKHPALMVIKECMGDIVRCCSELGLTPAARARLVVPREKSSPDELDYFGD